jgi:transcriptional regulator with XRE-family HTH domain
VAKKPANPTDKYVGSRVRMRRMMLAVSQTDLADQLGLIFQQVQKYENGTNRISASRLQQSAHILRVPVTFFFEGAPSVLGAARRAQGMAPSFGLAGTLSLHRPWCPPKGQLMKFRI